MRIFLSWSGELSRKVAEILRTYLPVMIQGLETFMSKHDLESGTRWSVELARQLEDSTFGILCLTADNLNSPWLLFEAGALTKHVEGRACGLLVGTLKPTDVTGPLSQFQHRSFSEADLQALLRDVNAKLPKPLEFSQLQMVFQKWWPDIEREYQAALKAVVSDPKPPLREQREILEEILGRIRSLERTLERPGSMSATVKQLLDNLSASLTERQRRMMYDISRFSEAGVPLPIEHVPPEDLQALTQNNLVRDSGGAVVPVHKLIAEYFKST
jgi:TIR domain